MSGVVAVYGGGGAKAAAHLGAERALREKGLAPVGYVGCSLGAVVAAALALGWGPAAVEERMVELGRRRIAVVDPLIFLLGVKRRSLLKPTCALPLYFPPVLIGGRRYVDGGIRSVLPIESALLYSPDRVVAVDVGPGFDEAPATSGATLPALIEINQSSIGIAMAQGTLDRLDLWKLTPGRPPLTYVRPRVEKNATFATDKLRAYAEEGYRATIEAISQPPSAIGR